MIHPKAALRMIRTGLLLAETRGHTRMGPRLAGADDPSRARERAALLADAAAAALAIHDVRVHVDGVIGAGPAVLVANHKGWLDPLVLLSVHPCLPIVQREVASWSAVGPLLRELGCAFVARDDPHSGARALRRGLRALSSGVAVLGFPEARSTRRGLLPFRRGLFGLARLAGVPIIPLSIRVDDDGASLGDVDVPDFWRACSRGRVDVHVKVGAAMVVPKNLAPSLAAARARASVLRQLEEEPPLASVFAQHAWSVAFDGVTP